MNSNITLNITPQDKQWDAIRALNTHPVVFYGGAKGGGKSRLVRDYMLMRRKKYPGTKGVIIRKTFAELDSNHIQKILQEQPDLRPYYKSGEKSIIMDNQGGRLDFRYLLHTKDVYNFQGLEYEDIAVDEITQHAEEVGKILRSSNRTTNKLIKPRMLYTGNPGGIGNAWVKRLFIKKNFNKEEVPEDYAFVQAYVYDNKTLMDNDPEYVKRLESLPEYLKRMYLYGDWDVFQGQFFEMWNHDKHVIEPLCEYRKLPDSYKYILAWDDGMLAPRSVGLLMQDNDSKVSLVWEYYKRGETAIQSAENIADALNEMGLLAKVRKYGKFVYDPSMDIKSTQSGVGTAELVEKILGIRREAGNNTRVEGWRRFKEFLRWSETEEPLFRVWNCCNDTTRTIPELIYDENNPNDLDSDTEDHAADMIRYGLMALDRLPERFKLEKYKEKSVIIKKQRTYINKLIGY